MNSHINVPIYVTLTSWPKRINNVISVLDSIFRNTRPPNGVFLNLSVEEFPNLENDLPITLQLFAKANKNLFINWVSGPNTKAFKKIVPMLKYVNDDDIIISMDDDFRMPVDLIEKRIIDFLIYKKQHPITPNTRNYTNTSHAKLAYYMSPTSVFTKRMFANWEKWYTPEVISSLEDDRANTYIFASNNYYFKPASEYSLNTLVASQKYNISNSDSFALSKQYVRAINETEELLNSMLNYNLTGYLDIKSTANTYYNNDYIISNIALDNFKKEYFKIWKKYPNLENPVYWDELWANKYFSGFYHAKYYLADKVAVRDYLIRNKLDHILTPLIGVYKSVKDIDINKLPNKFICKLNTGSKHILICKQKNLFNFDNAKKIMNKWLENNPFIPYYDFEDHYKFIEPQIIIEEYLTELDTDNLPTDYKFICANGEILFILVCLDRGTQIKFKAYDINWNEQDYIENSVKSVKIVNKPKHFNQMIEIAQQLSKNNGFISVDLFTINDTVYFSELTLAPAAFLFSYYNKKCFIEMTAKFIENDVFDKKQTPKIVVYSFVTNNVDNKPWPKINFKSDNIDYIMFTDDKNFTGKNREGWQIRIIKPKTPQYTYEDVNKIYKWSAFNYFGDAYDYAIYIDSKIEICKNPNDIINNTKLSKYGLSMYQYDYAPTSFNNAHIKNYKNIYAHGEYLLDVKAGRPAKIRAWLDDLNKQQFKMEGLVEGAVIITNLHNAIAKQLQIDILKTYLKSGTLRDQLVIPVILNKYSIDLLDIAVLGNYINGFKKNPLFRSTNLTNINTRQQLTINNIREQLNDVKVVVTLTSWPKRINNCSYIIDSIYKQTFKPDKIFLNLSVEEFPNKEKDLPPNLLIKDNIFKINWVKDNTKTFKKVFPILPSLNNNDIIIYTDDDIILPPKFIESRLSDYLKYDKRVAISGASVRSNSRSQQLVNRYGIKVMPGSTATSLVTKKMLKNYKLLLTPDIINTYNDDLIYLLLLYLNGYQFEYCSNYSIWTSEIDIKRGIQQLKQSLNNDAFRPKSGYGNLNIKLLEYFDDLITNNKQLFVDKFTPDIVHKLIR